MTNKRKFPLVGFVFFIIGLGLLNVNKGSAIAFMAIGGMFALMTIGKRKEGDA